MPTFYLSIYIWLKHTAENMCVGSGRENTKVVVERAVAVAVAVAAVQVRVE